MMNNLEYDIVIIGGGPAGSTAALILSKAGFKTCLIEKKNFPREVLCGEFLSGEVSEILNELNLFEKFLSLNPIKLSKFRYVLNDREISTDLNFPAYAIKRSVFDDFLLNCALESGIIIHQPADVIDVIRDGDKFLVNVAMNREENFLITADFVIAAYGKQNILDKKLKRNFSISGMKSINNKSNYNGIKFHLNKNLLKNFPDNEIRIYAADNIYCGLNPVSDNEITLCFLEKRGNGNGSVRDRIKNLLQNNQSFRSLFEYKADEILRELPACLSRRQVYGTGNIYFGKKKAVEDGIFFIGDAAGMIAPFTGDGIGMAMYSAKILSSLIIQQKIKNYDRDHLDNKYTAAWNNSFLKRTKVALLVQQAILNKLYRQLSFKLIQTFPFLLPEIIKSTRNRIKNS